jgi:hypothetical protein
MVSSCAWGSWRWFWVRWSDTPGIWDRGLGIMLHYNDLIPVPQSLIPYLLFINEGGKKNPCKLT